MLGSKKSGPTLKDYDFTERLNRDRAIKDGRMPDPRLSDAGMTEGESPEHDASVAEDAPTEHSPASDWQTDIATETDGGFAEDRRSDDADADFAAAEYDAPYDAPAPHDAPYVDTRYDEAGYDSLAIDPSDAAYSDQNQPDSATSAATDPTPTSPRMLALRRWLMAAVNGLVWMFLTMWTLDKLHLFDTVFTSIDVTSATAGFYVAGIAVLALASLFIYLVKTFRTVIQPITWRTTASGLALGGLIGAVDGIGPSTHFLTLIVDNLPFI